MFTPPAEWYAPEKCTCSVWAAHQRYHLGGRISLQRHQKIPYLFRAFWQPPGKGTQWYAYLPDAPKDHRVEAWWTVLWDSLWFKGRPRQAYRRR